MGMVTGDDVTTAGAIRLRPPRERVHRRAIVWWVLQSVVFWGPILIVGGVAYVVWEPARGVLPVAMVVVAVLGLLNALVEPRWRYAVHRWETTDEAVYARTGWIVREWRVAPLSRIQTVDAVRGPLEQMLGLATLKVTTASSNGAIEIGGLDHEVADEIAEHLTQITQATPGDAT